MFRYEWNPPPEEEMVLKEGDSIEFSLSTLLSTEFSISPLLSAGKTHYDREIDLKRKIRIKILGFEKDEVKIAIKYPEASGKSMVKSHL